MEKHKVKFVIKGLKSGSWFYYTEHYNDRPYDELRNWQSDLYIARQFDNYIEAEQFLTEEGFAKLHWGGFFQVEKLFINR